MSNQLGENIRRARIAAGFRSQGAFADALKLPQSSVSRWETGAGSPDRSNLQRISRATSTPIERLLDGVGESDLIRQPDEVRTGTEDNQEAERLDVDVSAGYRPDDLPVIAEGEATPHGLIFWLEGQPLPIVEAWVSRPYDIDDPHAYGIRVRGDSMIPIYRQGTYVVVSPRGSVEDGDEVYVQLTSGERLIKIARRAPQGGWMLESANPAYAPRFVRKSDIVAMHPIVWSRRKMLGIRTLDDRGKRVPPKE